MQTPKLTDHLATLCAQRNEVREHVIQRSGIDRVYEHQIFSSLKQPTRDKLIQLAIGFRLDVKQTQQLLRVGMKSPLYPRVKRDAAILFCIERQKDVIETQNMLSELRLPILGGEKRRE